MKASPGESEEWFDLVDTEDRVVGKALRSEVHRRRLRHRAVHMLVFDSAGRCFLQKRAMRKDEFPGVWDSAAAGHLDVGEEYDDAAARELEEELGVILADRKSLQPLFKINACEATGEEFVWIYRYLADGPFKLHKEEIERGQWFSIEAIDKWINEHPEEFTSAFPLIWERLKAGCDGITQFLPPKL